MEIAPNVSEKRFKKTRKSVRASLIRSLSQASIGIGEAGNRGRGRGRGLGIAATAKVLTRAANWRAKSLQAKTERRERRATKTLAIVLGINLPIHSATGRSICGTLRKGIFLEIF